MYQLIFHTIHYNHNYHHEQRQQLYNPYTADYRIVGGVEYKLSSTDRIIQRTATVAEEDYTITIFDKTPLRMLLIHDKCICNYDDDDCDDDAKLSLTFYSKR